MTLHIEDLASPIARGRAAAVVAIGQRLELMRAEGVPPDVALRQEAFGKVVRAIGLTAGYADAIAGGPASLLQRGS